MPNVVLLEESEPNTLYDALTASTTRSGATYLILVGQCTPDKNVTYVSDVMPRQ